MAVTRKILRLRDVEAVTGLSKSSVYQMMQDGTFPRAVKLTAKAVGWFEDEIEAWLSSRERTTKDGGE